MAHTTSHFLSRNLENGGIYSGAGGLAYVFHHLSQLSIFSDESESLKSQAFALAEANTQFCIKYASKGNIVSFFYSSGGLYATAAAIFKVNGKENRALEYLERYIHGQWTCKDVSYSLTGSDDMANGRSGYITGLLWLVNYFSINELRLYTLYDLLKVVMESGKITKPWRDKGMPGASFYSPILYRSMDTCYLGMLMGMAGIFRLFLLCPFFLEDKAADKEIRMAVDAILYLQRADGSFPDKLEDISDNKSSYELYAKWSSGATGIAFLMAAAYLRWKDQIYLDSCQKCCDFAWNNGLCKHNIGIGNGVAGNCYLFLIMYRLTKEEKYIHRALNFSEFLTSEKYLGTLLANSSQLKNYSLMEGLGGVAIMLADLIDPSEAEFPFMPLFTLTTRVH